MSQNREAAAPEESFDTSGMSPVTQVIVGAGVILVCLLISKLYFDQYLELKKLHAKHEVERTKNTEYRQHIGALQSECRLAQTTQGIEIMARERLKFIHPDEIMVIPQKK